MTPSRHSCMMCKKTGFSVHEDFCSFACYNEARAAIAKWKKDGKEARERQVTDDKLKHDAECEAREGE